MKNLKWLISIAALIVAFLVFREWNKIVSPKFYQRSDQTPKKGPEMPGGGETTTENSISILAVGKIKYESSEEKRSSSDWVRRILPNIPSEFAPSEEDLAIFDADQRWAKTNVYYFEDGHIAHISTNKNTYATYPMDTQAIGDLQAKFGLAIIKIGYSSSLIEAGYTKFDFLSAIYDHWNKQNDDEEYEVTPVVVKIVPITNSEAFPDGNPHEKFMGQEFPMILTKSGRLFQADDANWKKNDFTDEFSHKESIFRAWALSTYVPIEIDGKMQLPKIGGSVVLSEPFMEAVQKHRDATKSKQR